MKTERIVLAVIAIILGSAVAGIAFFIYQSTKVVPENKIQAIKTISPTPSPASSITLTIDSPSDESVTNKKSISITGKTNPDVTLVLNTTTDDQVVTPASNGNYSISTSLSSGENIISITAIAANGDEITKKITVTSSAEDF